MPCRIRTSGSPAWSTSGSRRSWRSSRTCARRSHRSGSSGSIFLNGHYDNTYAIAYACANAAEPHARDVQAFPVNYWDALTEDEIAEFSGLKNGLHANLAETSAVLAINPALVDLEKANAEFPPFPEFTVPDRPGAHRVLLHRSRLGLLGDQVRHVGRCAWVDARRGRTLPAGGRAIDARRAREHREDVRRDAATMTRGLVEGPAS